MSGGVKDLNGSCLPQTAAAASSAVVVGPHRRRFPCSPPETRCITNRHCNPKPSAACILFYPGLEDMEKGRMDGTNSREILVHLEKQSEVFMELFRSLSHELHKLQVEEEMLMRKFYEAMIVERGKENDKEESVST